MKTVVGILDGHKEAEKLQKDLIDSGFRRDAVKIERCDAKEAAGAARKEGKGFFQRVKELFGSSDVPEEHRDLYAEGVRRGGCLLAVSAEDNEADRAVEIMNRHGAVDIEKRAEHWKKAGWSRFDEKAPAYTAEEAARERKVIPVVEEEVRVGKRTVPTGNVRVYSRTSETPVEEKVSLREEHARIERRPVDRPATAADKEAFRETSYEVKETAEEPVISKEARVKEEVVIGKEATERTETVRDKIRRTTVKVDDEAFNTFYESLSIPEKEKDDRFDEYWSAYSYSRDRAKEKRFEGKHWSDVEGDLRSDWDKKHPGSWERLREAIRRGWEARH